MSNWRVGANVSPNSMNTFSLEQGTNSMVNVEVNGAPLMLPMEQLRSMGDLVELIKANIDPDSMIIDINFDGQVLSENDWHMPLSQHRGRTLKVATGSKQSYLVDRLVVADELIEKISEEFIQAATFYRDSNSPEGNGALALAVKDLSAFVNWYSSLIQLDSANSHANKLTFDAHVSNIKTISEQIFQNQLYQSWWVLADSISSKLKPELDALRITCANVASQVGIKN